MLVDGDVLELHDDGARLAAERVPAGRVSLEGTQLGDVDAETLRMRRRLAFDGIVLVADVAGKLRVTTLGVASESAAAHHRRSGSRRRSRSQRIPAGLDLATAVRRAVARAFTEARGKKPTRRRVGLSGDGERTEFGGGFTGVWS